MGLRDDLSCHTPSRVQGHLYNTEYILSSGIRNSAVIISVHVLHRYVYTYVCKGDWTQIIPLPNVRSLSQFQFHKAPVRLIPYSLTRC